MSFNAPEHWPVLLRDEREPFPDASRWTRADGLVALGGGLSVARLMAAYRAGLFPWTTEPVVGWWSPDPRAVIGLDAFHISRSLRRTLRKGRFTVTRDHAFEAVIRACAERSDGAATWITEELVAAYVALHRAGHAHSVECWSGDRLVGGVYGVAADGLFAGESMFHHETDASKVALSHLVAHLRERGFTLFDIQMVTPATLRLGAVEIPRAEYLRRLAAARGVRAEF
jgi:leucyl/phenylalanyl-tRNA---protein transferase